MSRETVAIFRALNLGDLLCATPAFRAIRAARPGAHIALIAQDWSSELVRRLDYYLDEHITFPGYPGLPEAAASIVEADAFCEGMRSRRFDLVLQMHGSGTNTNAIIARFGARDLGGYYPPGGPRPPAGTFIPYPGGLPEPHRHLALAEAAGFPSLGTVQATGTISNDDLAACTPRPRVTQTLSANGSTLTVHVEATPLHTLANNPLQQIRFGTFQNASVSIGGKMIPHGESIAMPPNTFATDIVVRRLTAGAPVTVPFRPTTAY